MINIESLDKENDFIYSGGLYCLILIQGLAYITIIRLVVVGTIIGWRY